MKRKIQKILEEHKEGKTKTHKAVNEILLLSVVKKSEVETCPICKEFIMINNVCPKCTVDLCSPLDEWVDL
jgi:ribosomal protein L32